MNTYLMNIYLPHEQAGIYDVNHLAEREEVAISPSPIIRDNTARLSLKCAIFNAGSPKLNRFSRLVRAVAYEREENIIIDLSECAGPTGLALLGDRLSGDL